MRLFSKILVIRASCSVFKILLKINCLRFMMNDKANMQIQPCIWYDQSQSYFRGFENGDSYSKTSLLTMFFKWGLWTQIYVPPPNHLAGHGTDTSSFPVIPFFFFLALDKFAGIFRRLYWLFHLILAQLCTFPLLSGLHCFHLTVMCSIQ